MFARCLDALIIWHFCSFHSDPRCKLYPTADTATADSTCSPRPPRDSQQLERGEISEAPQRLPWFLPGQVHPIWVQVDVAKTWAPTALREGVGAAISRIEIEPLSKVHDLCLKEDAAALLGRHLLGSVSFGEGGFAFFSKAFLDFVYKKQR